jgi:hypothetical protein
MEFLCCKERKALIQVKAHLVAKDGQCAHAGAVLPLNAVVQDMLYQIQVLSH